MEIISASHHVTYVILQARMILADDFLQTCYTTLLLSGHASMIILMRGIDSKYREICFNRAFNSDLKNVTNPCLPRAASRVVYPVYCVYHSSR